MDLSPPPPFDVYSQPNGVSRGWEKYVKTVRIYLAAKGINAGGRQRAILLHCAGSDIQDIAETNLTDTGADLNTLVSNFCDFSSRNNVVFERYEFRQCIQGEDEDIDSWHTRLRMKASTCEFGDQLDSLIRDQIVACCRSSKLRLKLLQVANISLQDTLKTARSLETANRQAAAIESDNYGVGPSPELATLGSPNLTSAYFNPRRSQRPRRSGNEPEWAKRERERKSQPSCYRCGELGHRTCEKTRGKTCQGVPGRPPPENFIGLEETTPETIAALSRAQSYSSDEKFFCIEPLLSADKDARVVISLNEARTRVLVDSGASVNVPMSIYNQIKQPRSKPKLTSISVYPYGSKLPLDIAGVAAIEVQAFGHQRTLDFIVSTSHGVALLGRKSATELDLLRVGPPPPPPNVRPVNTVDQHAVNINPPQRPGSTISNAALTQSPAAEHPLPEHLKTKNILSRYGKVFEGLGRVKNIQIEIHMKKNAIPVVHSPSRVPVHPSPR